MKKKVVIFDLDDTLTESKMPLGRQMGERIAELLDVCSVGIISGCAYEQFQTQFIENFSELSSQNTWNKLYLMPTSGVQLYIYTHKKWKRMYHSDLVLREKAEIYNAFIDAIKVSNINPNENPYGEVAEDRGSQITFSMCGQQAPPGIKKSWDPDRSKRLTLAASMDKILDGKYAITVGGATSVDVSRIGQDKAYGVNKFLAFMHAVPEEAIFIGDALFEGGNDYPVKTTGVECIETSGVGETLKLIDAFMEGYSAVI